MRLNSHVAGLMLVASAQTCSAGLFGNSEPMGMKTRCFEHFSRAYCALDAANLSAKLSDARKDQVEKAMRESGLGVADIGMIAGTAKGVISPMAGLSRLGSIGFMLLGSLTEQQAPIKGLNRIFAWMPMEMARSPGEAIDVLDNLVHQHARDTFKDYTFEDAAITRAWETSHYKLWGTTNRGWILAGPGCAGDQCSLTHVGNASPWMAPPVEGTAPEWLGGYKAWIFAMKAGLILDEWWTGQEFESPKYVPRLSAALPDWIFVSLSPEFRRGQIVFNRGLRMPMVYNKGKPLLLVFPELDSTSDAPPSPDGGR